MLQTLAAFIVALGVLIVVHEYGHYLVARLCGVRVLRFSVGFGRPLLVRKGRDGTEWVLAAVPFGGYVKMLDERETPVEAHERDRAFNRQSVWRRIAIVAAGPAFNFAFAIAVYAGLYMVGIPEARPVLAAPPAGSLAAQAGFAAQDRISAIDGEAVPTWQALRWRIVQAALQKETVRIERHSARHHIDTLVLDLRGIGEIEANEDPMERIGLRLYRPALEPVLEQVVEGGAARRAGLAAGDRITHVDGDAIERWSELVEEIRARPGQAMRLGVLRGERRLEIVVIPDAVGAEGARIGRIGAAPRVPEDYAETLVVRTQHGPVEALVRGVKKTYDISIFSLRMLGRMLIGEVSWKHLSGPVTIADYAGQSAQLGWMSYLTFLALVSISLGVLNLLPIPLLDGGHLLYYAAEIIKGSPVSDRVMEVGQRVGLTLLLVLMAFAFYNDLNRLFTG